VNWLQDLYPEVAIQFGLKTVSGPAGAMLRSMRNASLKLAAVNVAIGDLMADRLRDLNIPEDRIQVIPNWASDHQIRPSVVAVNSLRDQWSLNDKFVVCYSGNLGRAHEAETLLDAAEKLKYEQQVCFLLIGGGSGRSSIEAAVRKRGLTSFVFKPHQPYERLHESLGVADLHWLSLRPEFEGFMVPSKFYGIAAAGRPIISIGAIDGELARLIRKYNCGAVIEQGDSNGLATVIMDFFENSTKRKECGQKARHMLDESFRRAHSLEKWRNLLLH
jgi:glycosyltransferase involved in cell wall biosynthesis